MFSTRKEEMFTGIVREVGRVLKFEVVGEGARLVVDAPGSTPRLSRGDSIAVNGCCVTVVEHDFSHFSCDLVSETLKRTTFSTARLGDRVNLEPSLRLGDSLDGHWVQGHVDGVGHVESIDRQGALHWQVRFSAPAELLPLIASKGSIAVHGVSLTVVQAQMSGFTVALIPTTLAETNLGDLDQGTPVNLEVDLVARYLARRREWELR